MSRPQISTSLSGSSNQPNGNLQHLPQPSYRRAPPIQVQQTRYTDRDMAMSPAEMEPPVQVFAQNGGGGGGAGRSSPGGSGVASGSGTPAGYRNDQSRAQEAYRQNSSGSQQQQLPARSSSRSVSQSQQRANTTSSSAFVESDPNAHAPTPAQQIVYSVQQQQQQQQQHQQQQQQRQRQTSAQYPSYDSYNAERDLPAPPVAMSANDPYYAQAQARLAEQGGAGGNMGMPGQGGGMRTESQYNMQSLQSKRSMSTLPFVGEMGEDRMRRDSALPAPLLDQSHLRPGKSASLLTHDRTLELYRENAKKTNDPELIFEFSVFMIDAAKSMVPSDTPSDPDLANPSPSNPGAGPGRSLNALIDKRDELYKEATTLLKKLADKGYPDAQYYLADCYANGIGTVRGRQDFDRAFPLFVLAAKHGHPDACYRAGTCCEHGWGCRKENAKAVQFYKKAAVGLHPGAMYRLGLAELNGNLGLSRSPREGVKWLKRSAEHATEEFPHALHELALLHEQGIDNVVFVDNEYAAELLAQASELGYAPSAFKLGECYEYGKMDCPVDPALSIHYYNIAATQEHPDACFALTAWYLVGSPGVLPQSDTEAYLWAKKAAESGLAKAQYAVGYFTETGIGSEADMAAAMTWYKLAAESGDKRAQKRLQSGSKSAALDRRLEMEALKEERGAKGGKGGDKEGCVVM